MLFLVMRNGVLARCLWKRLKNDVRVLNRVDLEKLGMEVIPLRNPVQLERQDVGWQA